jgi:hypothetical protein
MNLRKILIIGGVMLQLMSSSCAKIDKFSSSHMLEGFTGIVKVTPGIEGITAKPTRQVLYFSTAIKMELKPLFTGPIQKIFRSIAFFLKAETPKNNCEIKWRRKESMSWISLISLGFARRLILRWKKNNVL